MAKWLVWYTSLEGRGDSAIVEANTRDEAAECVLDNDNLDAETIDNVEEMRGR